MKIGDVVGGTNQQASKRVNYEGKVMEMFNSYFICGFIFLCKKNYIYILLHLHKSLWIKVSAKQINVNEKIYIYTIYFVQVIIAQKAINNRL